jgi:hypothetical protein
MENKPKITAEESRALLKLFEAWRDLKKLGWEEPRYFKWPAPHVEFELIELGSTGIHRAVRMSIAPIETCWVDRNWPSQPFLVRHLLQQNNA